MRPIPPQMRQSMDSDPFYHKCVICGCQGVQWHHNLVFAGRQVNEEWAIIPLCPFDHDQARNSEFKESLDWIMLNRATDDELRPFCKATDYIFMRKKLNEKYGSYSPT